MRKAFNYYQKGLKIAEEKNIKLEQSYFYHHLGLLYQFYHEDLNKALEFQKKSAELRKEIGFKLNLHNAYFAVGMVYYFKKDFESAMDYFKKAYSAAENIGYKEVLRNHLIKNGDAVEAKDGLEPALKYFKLALLAAKGSNDVEGIRVINLKIKNLSKKV